ncbi:hypothetical protein GX48_05518 [Paracoccidioides brasiliensis]|nr:hypothetical protein GX48_05518 [Paracoccidioides brasiliensis]
MGKSGRIACIFTPYLLTTASLICLILVGLGLTRSSAPLNSIYFARVDLKDLNLDSTGIPKEFLPFFLDMQQADSRGKIDDFYLIGLWNHCSGQYTNGEYKIRECTRPRTQYSFDPVAVWGLQNGNRSLAQFLPAGLDRGLSTYRQLAKWMFAAFTVALVATCAELLLGIAAVFSRWGSFVVTIVSVISSFFVVAAAITATGVYATLVGVVNVSLRPYNVRSNLGKRMYTILWIGVVFSVASGLFWLFSVCCCSGRSPYSHSRDRRNKHTTAEKTPYTYERVASPYGGAAAAAPAFAGGNGNPNGRDMAYEPFRHGMRA